MADPGNLEQLPDGAWRLRFVRRLPHGLADVWRAIDDPDQLAAWFPSTIDGERRAGAPLRFRFPEMPEAEPISGEMLAYDPPRLMEIRWGPDIIRIELRERDGATELTLLDTLEDRGKGARDGAGWHACLDALQAALAGDPAARSQLRTAGGLMSDYRRRFGPDAARIGPPSR